MYKKNLIVFFIALILLFPSKVNAYDLAQEEKDLFREQGRTVQVLSYDNKQLHVTDNDIHLMAKVVHAESVGEPYEGKVAVASVILNRLKNPAFPKSIEGVIKQPRAFSCVINGEIKAEPNEHCYRAVIDALSGKDPTNNSLFFYNPKIATSTWMKNVEKDNVKSIGNHVFFIAK
ncbi:cell wall hydrolase [Clostridium sp. MSJ-11]|uniref:Cell wall hydrolase n=1 Tax=Clostridium mobile TaxID=2841512 RepID=A0ABS6EIN4_9CLOT|nr:cell wall hydrolase [Clostridium mobile]MBU5485088.1 cell wall hydrolase [Clostridium mobile]